MAIRTNESEVQAVIETQDGHDLSPFIINASVLVDRVSTKAIENGTTLSDNELKVIETYIAAHLYFLRYPKVAELNRGKVKAKFQVGQLGKGLDSSFWGQYALSLDHSGTLASVTGSNKAGVQHVEAVWLGTESTP